MSTRLKLFLFALLCTCTAVYWQEQSIKHLDNQLPAKNGLITSADEASYHEPSKNFLKDGVWKDQSIGSSAYVQRPPGYGVLLLPLVSFFGESYFFALKILNITCFFIGIFLIYGIIRQWGIAEKMAIVLTALIGFFPATGSMMYFTITESVSPVFILWCIFEWQRPSQMWNVRFMLSGGFLLLLRPQLLALLIGMFVFSFFLKKKRAIPDLLVFLPLCLWLIRVWIYTGTPSLHPIYSDDNHSLYREPHRAMTELFKIWEYDSRNFHQTLALTIQNDSVPYLDAIPDKYKEDMGPLLVKYSSLVNRMESQGINTKLIHDEHRFANEVDMKSKNLVLKNPLQAYVITPVKSAIFLLRPSHLHQAVFQKAWRGNPFVELLRFASIGIICSSFVLVFLLPFYYRSLSLPPQFFVFSLSFLLYFLYLVFVQRLNEDRYLYPLIPIVLSMSLLVILKWKNHNGQGFWFHRKS